MVAKAGQFHPSQMLEEPRAYGLLHVAYDTFAYCYEKHPFIP